MILRSLPLQDVQGAQLCSDGGPICLEGRADHYISSISSASWAVSSFSLWPFISSTAVPHVEGELLILLYTGHYLMFTFPLIAQGPESPRQQTWVQPNSKARKCRGHSHPQEQGLLPSQQLGSFKGLKRRQLLVSKSLGGGRSGLPAEVQRALEPQCTLLLPLSPTLSTPCFPSMKTVNLFYFHQS